MSNSGSSDKAPLYIIDGSAYLYRAYFSMTRQLTSSKGVPTRAVYVITNMLLKILREKDPRFIAVAWDAKGPTVRHELYKEYKANRPPMPEDLQEQVPYVRRLVEALGLAQLEVDGYEADDIIATLVKQARKEGRPVVIVSGDKDLMQLVSDGVVMWDPMKDEIIDLEEFRKRFGLEPRQFRDVLALAGDSADNIPGVPGIGPKTAQKLIAKYGSVEEIVRHIHELKGKLKERLEENRDALALWERITALHDDVPLDVSIKDLERRPMDKEALRELFEELDFLSLLPMVGGDKITITGSYRTIIGRQELERWLEEGLRDGGTLVIDTETTSEDPMRADLVGVSFCLNPPEAVYCPVGHLVDEKQMGFSDLMDVVQDRVVDAMARGVELVGQNIKYDMIVLRRCGIKWDEISGDTMVASYLIDPTKRRHGLDEIAREVLGHQMISYKEVTKGLKKGESFAALPIDKARDYTCEDVHITFLANERFKEELREKELWDLYTRVEVPLVPVLADMEMAGILVDRQGLQELRQEFSERLKALADEIYELAGEEFNINSTRHLARILFEKLGLPQVKKTKKKTGYSTDMEVLKELSKLHPLPKKLIQYRNLSKLKNTYIDGLEKEINPDTGRVHTSFNQTVTATGRLSSSDPNLQNIPVRTEEGRRIRALFKAADGNLLISADYSQIDLRVLAHYSRDPALVDAFKRGEDIHRRTAAEIFDVAPELVTPDMRRAAKTVNFGIIYGMSPFGLAKELGIERREAKRFIDRYFARYPGVKAYMERAIKEARQKGYVSTILGRRRYIKEINSKNRVVRQFAERTAINTPIQGSAADIIKLAMLRVSRWFKEEMTGAAMLLQVHDELVVECRQADVEQVAEGIRERMEHAASLIVPLKVSVGWGPNWAEVK